MIEAPLHLQKLIGKEFAFEEYSQLKMDSQPWKKVYFREHSETLSIKFLNLQTSVEVRLEVKCL